MSRSSPVAGHSPGFLAFALTLASAALLFAAAHGSGRRRPGADGAPVGRGLAEDAHPEARGARAELKASNATLESRVAARTVELELRAARLRSLAVELTRTEQRERRRLALMLHDNLQQLLAAARMWLGMLRGAAPGPDARDAAGQVDALITEAIDVTRALTMELSPPTLHEAGLAPSLARLACWMRDKHALHVETHLDEGLRLSGDDVGALLFQAAREALLNVVRHADTDRASLALKALDGRTVIVTVRDEGAGFDSSAAAGPGGARALGLHGVRDRLELFGGEMAIESAPGSGTLVTLIAPLADCSAAEAPAGGGDAPAAAEAHPWAAPEDGHIRVMLVDDQEIMRAGLAGLLAQQEDIVIVAEAADGREAVEIARAVRPQVIVMDVSMPRMNGVEATRRIMADAPGTRVHRPLDARRPGHRGGDARGRRGRLPEQGRSR